MAENGPIPGSASLSPDPLVTLVTLLLVNTVYARARVYGSTSVGVTSVTTPRPAAGAAGYLPPGFTPACGELPMSIPTFGAPPPSRWVVTTPTAELTIKATYASVTQRGTLLFHDESRQLLRAFVESKWLLVEQILDGEKPARVSGVRQSRSSP